MCLLIYTPYTNNAYEFLVTLSTNDILGRYLSALIEMYYYFANCIPECFCTNLKSIKAGRHSVTFDFV